MQRAFLASLLLFACACGGAKPKAEVGPPLTAEQAKAYDQGVDFVATLEGLEGRWRDDWDRDLAARVGSADLIAVVTVRTLRTDTDPEQRITHRLVAEIDRALIGKVDGEEIVLPVREDQPGFTSVHENLGRVTDKQFIAYVKVGAEGPHWHLSPAAEPIVVETESQITQLERAPNKSTGERVIVHTH